MTAGSDAPSDAAAGRAAGGPRIVITYCTRCNWLLRAGWMAQELLHSFAGDLGEVALRPGTGGVFTIALDDELLWDRGADGGFPDIKTLKQRARDRLAPGRDLGHYDRAGRAPPDV